MGGIRNPQSAIRNFRRRRPRPGLWLFAAWLLASSPAWADGLGWRGDGTGRYPNAQPPLKWDIDAGTGILWKAVVGKGQSTPVVAAGRILLTAEPDTLMCLDAAAGKVLWKAANGYDTLPPGTKHPDKNPPTATGCGYATPTPVVDAGCVYASFGTGIVVCFDLDGRRKWVRFLDVKQVTEYGRAASPLLVKGKLLVSIGGLAALDARTGETLWHAKEAKPLYGTPAAASVGGVDVVLTPAGDCVRVSDGHVLAKKLAATQYSSPICHDGVAYFAGVPAVAVKLPDRADADAKFTRLWESDDTEGVFFASPVLHDGILYCVSNEGVLYALDARTGKLVYQKELEIPSAGGRPGMEAANIYASLTLAGKHLFLANDVGHTLVLAPGKEYKEVSHNCLDAGPGASPVADGGCLFLRGGAKLYCLGLGAKPRAAKAGN